MYQWEKQIRQLVEEIDSSIQAHDAAVFFSPRGTGMSHLGEMAPLRRAAVSPGLQEKGTELYRMESALDILRDYAIMWTWKADFPSERRFA